MFVLIFKVFQLIVIVDNMSFGSSWPGNGFFEICVALLFLWSKWEQLLWWEHFDEDSKFDSKKWKFYIVQIDRRYFPLLLGLWNLRTERTPLYENEHSKRSVRTVREQDIDFLSKLVNMTKNFQHSSRNLPTIASHMPKMLLKWEQFMKLLLRFSILSNPKLPKSIIGENAFKKFHYNIAQKW